MVEYRIEFSIHPRDDFHGLVVLLYPRHRARCGRCNPAGNPRPLIVNGREYRRRQRARRRLR